MSLRYGLVIEFGILIVVVSLVLFYIISIIKTKDDEDYDKIISEYQEYEQNKRNALEKGNKLINNIEKEILECKKKLGCRLFK